MRLNLTSLCASVTGEVGETVMCDSSVYRLSQKWKWILCVPTGVSKQSIIITVNQLHSQGVESVS